MCDPGIKHFNQLLMMESLSKQELISTITKQADQIKRYEGRLRGGLLFLYELRTLYTIVDM